MAAVIQIWGEDSVIMIAENARFSYHVQIISIIFFLFSSASPRFAIRLYRCIPYWLQTLSLYSINSGSLLDDFQVAHLFASPRPASLGSVSWAFVWSSKKGASRSSSKKTNVRITTATTTTMNLGIHSGAIHSFSLTRPDQTIRRRWVSLSLIYSICVCMKMRGCRSWFWVAYREL